MPLGRTKTTTEKCNFDSNKKRGRKNSKNKSEIAAFEQKTTCDKAKFCPNTVFSL